MCNNNVAMNKFQSCFYHGFAKDSNVQVSKAFPNANFEWVKKEMTLTFDVHLIKLHLPASEYFSKID